MSMIEVTTDYGGVATNWQRIRVGLYASDAPELHGLADFLVSTGRARRVVAEPAAQPAPEVEEPETVATPEEPAAPKPTTRRGGKAVVR